MGKGDKKTTKGKRARGSFGKTRARSKSNPVVVVKAKPAKTPKVAAAVEEKAEKPAVKKAAAKKPTAAKKPAAAKKTTTKKAPAKK
jgi:30S ribosomal protein S31